jgi:DNA invertase Pin-like site-specific DNA recombinase
VLVVTKLDRLARSVADVVDIERKLKAKCAELLIISPAMDTASPAGRLMFSVIASIAQFERDIMLARQLEGIAKAKRDGKYKGQKPTARAKADELLRLIAEGMNQTQAAKQAGISRRSACRIVKEGEAGCEKWAQRVAEWGN